MANGSITFGPKLIEAVQTVVPLKPTDPRRSRLVTLKENISLGIFRQWVHTVLYHKKVSQEDYGRLLAGWIKESLGKALLEQPSFAGRLRRIDDGDQIFEVVSNDSGVRLYEAQMATSLEEFLYSEDTEEGEAQLVHWEDIDELNPQFCPLFYVQVTNFKCGGYSIGFSCSILLADPFTMASFLKKWANIHNNIVSEAERPKLPLFYFTNIVKTGSSIKNRNGFVLSKNSGQTSIIKVTLDSTNLDQAMKKALAGLCIEEAGLNLGIKLPAVFSLYVKEPSEEIKVEIFSKNENVSRPTSILSGLSSTSWDDLRAHEICFQEPNRPTHVSSWINSIADDGLVMVIPYFDEGISGIKIVVSIPNEKVT